MAQVPADPVTVARPPHPLPLHHPFCFLVLVPVRGMLRRGNSSCKRGVLSC